MSLTSIGPTETRGTYISFHLVGKSESGKTERWEVRADCGDVIGWVYWYPRWRKYIYHPKTATVYEEKCLREIAEFVESETKGHRHEKLK